MRVSEVAEDVSKTGMSDNGVFIAAAAVVVAKSQEEDEAAAQAASSSADGFVKGRSLTGSSRSRSATEERRGFSLSAICSAHQVAVRARLVWAVSSLILAAKARTSETIK